jgi:hypothetical protein
VIILPDSIGKPDPGRKKVPVAVTILLNMEFPADWDEDAIDFKLNDSSWCASNLIPEIEAAAKEDGCLCGRCSYEINPKEAES